MKIIGIIGAMDIEISDIVKSMKNINRIKHAGQEFIIGTIDGSTCEIVVTCSGIGKVCAAISSQILISNFNVEAIINTGIAGSMDDSLNIGDVVISQILKYHDFNKNLLNTYYPYKEEFTADDRLITLAQNAIKSIKDRKLNYKTGLIITGDIFLEDKILKNTLKKQFSPLCIEMEGCAIAHCCAKNNIPFVIIRSISDTSDDESVYENFKHKVATLSASIVVDMVININTEN